MSESLRTELLEAMYKLGSEVGYYHHSEIGWVSEAYNKQVARAAGYGIEDLLKQRYIKGKADGVNRKKHESDTSARAEVPEPAQMPNLERLPPAYRMVALPEATSAPKNIEQPKMVDRPGALDGFAPVSPK
ncbi:MAG: hypothetical protein EF813_04170 [Methanosarcinales archaeon]|nr:MAG: hypothetical protein EF813_04170 [Methanosarcinales archaeon]